MTTLIAAYDSDGCVGRCDAKCYNATGEHCDCVCGGANHGVGLKQALENTTEMVEQWMERYREEHPNVGEFKVNPALAQLDMFELMEAS